MTDALQIVLAKRPVGDVTLDCFREEKASLAKALRAGLAAAKRGPTHNPVH